MVEELQIEISAKEMTAQAFAKVQKQIGDLSAASDASAKQLGALADMAGKLAQKGADMAGFGGNVVGLLRGGAIVGAIGLALNELHKFNDEIVQSIAKTVEQAAALHMTSERFQSYTYALAKAGMAQGETASTLDRQRQLQLQAMDGNAAAIESYQKLGVKIMDANGKRRDEAAITTEVARAILAMTDADKQAAAAKDQLGLSGLRAVPALKQLANSSDDLERSARAAHAILDEKLAKSIADSTVKSQQAGLAIRGFYAEVAMPINMAFINIHIEAIAKIVGLLKDGAQWTREFYAALAGGASVAQAQVVAGLSGYDVKATREKIAQLEREIAEGSKPTSLEKYSPAHASPDGPARRMAGRIAELERLKAGLGEIEARAAADAAAVATAQAERERRNVNAQLGLPITPPGVTRSSFGGDKDPDKIVPGTGGGAGGDRIETAINRLKGEKAAAEDALADMMAGTHLPLPDLERAIALEKKIADEVARLGATNPNDPRIAQIEGLVTAREKAEAAFKRFDQSSKEAVQTEKALGDGTLYLRDRQRELNDQLASGRLGWETYSVAMQQATEKAEDMRLKLAGQKGGFEGLVAGMEYAANQYERNNRVWQRGQKIFDGVTDAMGQALSDFVTKGEVDFQRLTQSFIAMIIQMEVKAAASAVWQALGGFGGIAMALGFGDWGEDGYTVGPDVAATQGYAVDYGTGAYGAPPGGAAPGGAFAEGGDPPVGEPSWVGELGKELFVPQLPGTVFNQRQLREMFGGGRNGSGETVVVQQTNHFGAGVTRAEVMGMIPEIVRVTKGAVQDARQRGGKFAGAFR